MQKEEKGKAVKEAFPKVRIVLGGLEDAKILEEEAAKADVVIRRECLQSSCDEDKY